MVKKVSVDKVEVRTHDGPMLLPEGLSDERAIEVLQRKIAYESQKFEVDAEFTDTFIWEAAFAFSKVLERDYGWAGARTKVVETFFGPLRIPPRMIGVKTGPNENVQIPWGQFTIPGINGYLESSSVQHVRGGPHYFKITGEVKRRDEKKVNDLINAVRKYVQQHSIYRNRAFRLRLTDDSGEHLQFPDINFETLEPKLEAELVLPHDTDRLVRVNLFTPIERTDEVRKHGVPLKRGVLLAGQYGTGKTMIANVTGVKALRNGWTYIVCDKPWELADIIRVARRYQPCVVFCEDIDRIVQDERNIGVDEILNVIDGVESKGTEIMVVLTTNDIDAINPALLRPGRLDAIALVGPPDADAAERLARMYSRGLILPDSSLERSKAMMAGKIPAVIREIVERSKLAAVDTIEPGEAFQIQDDDLVIATLEMDEHIRRATPRQEDKRSDREKAADRLGGWLAITNGMVPQDQLAAAHIVAGLVEGPTDRGADQRAEAVRTLDPKWIESMEVQPATGDGSLG
jgi:hypothetical protein